VTPPKKDDTAELAAGLAMVVGRLNRRMLKGGQGLSHGVLSALSSVVKFGPLRPGDLAIKENVAAATITRIIARLEVDGLVQREVDPRDRRAFVIEATEPGTELIVRARSARADVIADLLRSVNAKDRDVLRRALPSLEALLGGDVAESSGAESSGVESARVQPADGIAS
jgi:DNA-binding MarR family transcriptional regulator